LPKAPFNGAYLLLCLFFRSFFLRLWVAIFRSLRFLPQGIQLSLNPYLRHIRGKYRFLSIAIPEADKFNNFFIKKS